MFPKTLPDNTHRIVTNPFPTMTVHGGGTGWRIRMIDVHIHYPCKHPPEGERHFKLQELTSEKFEYKDDAVAYMQTLQQLWHVPGACLVCEDIIKHTFTKIHEETFQAN